MPISDAEPPPKLWAVMVQAVVQSAMAYGAAEALDRRVEGIWAAIVVMVPVGCSLVLLGELKQLAMARGQSAGWGWMAVLGPIGVVVVYFLPDRSAQPGHGFPVRLEREHAGEDGT